jgi:hypothetical protein
MPMSPYCAHKYLVRLRRFCEDSEVAPTLVDGHTPSPYEEVTVASRNVVNSAPMASGQKRSSGIFAPPAGMKQVQTKSQEQ